MGDDEDDLRQRVAYGVASQPSVASRGDRSDAARMRPHLRMTQAGTVTAVVAAGAAIVAVVTYPVSAGSGVGYTWALVLLVCAAALAAICGYQLFCWTRAVKAWLGREAAPSGRRAGVSYAAHLASYPVLVLALWAGIAGSAYAGWTGTSAVLQTVTVALMLAAQTLAGVQYLRQSGPPGTIPAHLRRLVQQQNRRARRVTPGS